MSTFIIGTRECPIYPNAVPKDIIFINGAILSNKHPDFKNANRSIVLSPHILVNNFQDLIKYKPDLNVNRVNRFKNIRKKLMEDYFSDIYIRPISDNYHFDFNYKNINCNNINIFENNDFDKFLLESFDLSNYFKRIKFLFNNFENEPKNIIKYFLNRISIKMMNNFKVSTGILGLMIAKKFEKFKPPYFVIGIGLDRSGYSYDNKIIVDRNNHLRADLNYINFIIKNKDLLKDVHFTNKDIAKLMY